MSDFTVYPRSMDFGNIPAGVQSPVQWAHLTNHTGGMLDRDDWGINGPFTSQRPKLRQMNPAALTELRTNAPVSGDSRWVYGYGDYIFEGNTTTGIGVFKVDATGLAIEVSRYTSIVPISTGNGFYHDERFLYVYSAIGLHVLKLDKYGNLLLCDTIDPNGWQVEAVHGYGKYICVVDRIGITILSVDHRGQITVIDDAALSLGKRVWMRDGWVFASNATELKSYKIDENGFLTAAGTRTLGAGAYENLTGDESFIYTTDDTGTDDLYSLTIDDAGAFTLADSATLTTPTHYGLFYDGGYLQVLNGVQLNSYSVDRLTGVLALVLTNDSYGPEELVDGDMEAGPGPEELVDGDMEAGPGPEEMVDGDMEAVGVGAWAVGNNATLTKETGTPHGGVRCLRVAYNGTVTPYGYQVALVAGRSYNITGYARSDGSGLPRVRDGWAIYWTGTTSTSWQAFDVTFMVRTSWVMLQTVISGSGYCEFDDVSVKETCPDWTPGGNALLTKSTASPHGGSQALRVEYTDTNYPRAEQVILTIGITYCVEGWGRGDGSKAPRITDNGGTTVWTGVVSSSWQNFSVDYVATGNTLRFWTWTTAAGWVEFDDITIKETCPDWTPGGNALLTKSTASPHGGSQALRVEYTDTGFSYARQTALTGAKSYRLIGWGRGDGSIAPYIKEGGNTLWTGAISTSWQLFTVDFISSGTTIDFKILAAGAGWVEFDDVSVKEIDDTFYDAWFDGEKLITARLEDGIGVFGFDDSRIRFPVYYTPLGYEDHAGDMNVQGVSIGVRGKSPATFDPYIVSNSDSITLDADVRWDKIAYEFYGSFDRVQDVKDANPQISAEIKARLYVPRGSIIKRPGAAPDSDSMIGAVEWRRS